MGQGAEGAKGQACLVAHIEALKLIVLPKVIRTLSVSAACRATFWSTQSKARSMCGLGFRGQGVEGASRCAWCASGAAPVAAEHLPPQHAAVLHRDGHPAPAAAGAVAAAHARRWQRALYHVRIGQDEAVLTQDKP